MWASERADERMGRDGFLGEFEQMLLLAAMRLGDNAYGVKLMEELETRVGRNGYSTRKYVPLVMRTTNCSAWMWKC